ncbi:NAD-dependent epimerase/dehydratase family protein [Vagococcus sp.]|uniref:NAD-dependent epimerase/dehydratase family protein n=1 Tax=Vagococcus sp. TaxID=1933889 RepID=UPI003F97F293
MQKPLVVFGGSGYIGQALCQAALHQKRPVISISQHGKPKKEHAWMNSAQMTWVSCNLLTSTLWKKYVQSSWACVNLIGIFFESSQKSYDQVIVTINQLISDEAEKNKVPYLFLSATAGPIGYLKAKKEAEKYLTSKSNPTTVIHSGLVTSSDRPFKKLQAFTIKTAAFIPGLRTLAQKSYPIELETLAQTILARLNQLEKRST